MNGCNQPSDPNNRPAVRLLSPVNDKIAGRRSGIVNPEFIPIADAVADASSYESWSRFCLENMDLLRAKARDSGMAAAPGV